MQSGEYDIMSDHDTTDGREQESENEIAEEVAPWNREYCDWCGEDVDQDSDDFPFYIYETHAARYGIESDDRYERTNVCIPCEERMAEKMEKLRRWLGLDPEENQADRAHSMMLLVDIVNSEPPGRDWEETIP